jgi:ribosomal protein S6--L-glutamate ligase
MRTHIAFLLGRPPSRASVLPEVIDRLRAAGSTVEVHVVEGPPFHLHGLKTADLVVLRGLPPTGLEAARSLEEEGVPCCNSVTSSLVAVDKVKSAGLLAAAGVPTPRTWTCDRWDDVVREASRRPIVVKPRGGSGGEGVRFLPDPLDASPSAWPPPFLVQERVDHDSVDRKLYTVGGEVDGVLRRWPPQTLRAKLGRPFRPDPAMADLARAAGAALGLELHGVDVVVDTAGRAVVVDVNAFPGYKGVAGAAACLADHLLRRARDVEVLR